MASSSATAPSAESPAASRRAWGYYTFGDDCVPYTFAAEHAVVPERGEKAVGHATDLSFSPDGLKILAGGSDRSVRVWAVPHQSFVQDVRRASRGTSRLPPRTAAAGRQSERRRFPRPTRSQHRPYAPDSLGSPMLTFRGGDAVYGSAWHPSSLCFAQAVKRQPVKLLTWREDSHEPRVRQQEVQEQLCWPPGVPSPRDPRCMPPRPLHPFPAAVRGRVLAVGGGRHH